MRKREIELLLLSVIRAHKHPDKKSEMERLADASEALFGNRRARGRPTSYDDLALFKIFDEVRKREIDGLRRATAKLNRRPQTPEWQAEIARDPKSVRAAARQFQHLSGSRTSDESTEDRLRRKARTPSTAQEMAELEALFDPEAPHTRTIVAILDLLESLGVPSETIWDENT